jgi:small redox-active disulfide protein 2
LAQRPIKLQVLGAGCERCEQLAANVQAAATALGVAFTLEKVADIGEILRFGVLTTPALVVDGKVVLTGQVPDVAAVKALLVAKSEPGTWNSEPGIRNPEPGRRDT